MNNKKYKMNKFITLKHWISESKIDNADAITDEIEKVEEERPFYGCIMMDSKIDDWQETHLDGIEEDDIYHGPDGNSYGLESDPHVTILYGIHEDEISSEVIGDVMKENMKPLTVLVDEVDIFENEEFDVVKYKLPVTEEMQEYRDLFLKFPNTQTFPDFHPHMTLSYVKPGLGKKYKRKLEEPFEVTFTKAVYSYHDDPEKPDEYKRKTVDLEKKPEKDESKDSK